MRRKQKVMTVFHLAMARMGQPSPIVHCALDTVCKIVRCHDKAGPSERAMTQVYMIQCATHGTVHLSRYCVETQPFPQLVALAINQLNKQAH